MEHVINHKSRIALLPVVWIAGASGVGLLTGLASPHGMAAYIYTAFVLGFTGGALSLVWEVCQGKRKRLSAGLPWIGLISGLLAFPISTLLSERLIYFPHDLYQFILIAFLTVVGSALDWIIGRILLRGP